MKANNLLPFKVKRLGWILLLPSLILGVMVMFFEFEIPGFSVRIPYEAGILSHQAGPNNLTNEIVAIILIAVLALIAFSEEKEEDEWVSKVRLESLQWSVYANYILLVFAILFVYGLEFSMVLVYNMYTIMILFILRFNYVLRVKFNPNKLDVHEK